MTEAVENPQASNLSLSVGPSSLNKRVMKLTANTLSGSSDFASAIQSLSSFSNVSQDLKQLKHMRSVLEKQTLLSHQYTSQHVTASEKTLFSLVGFLDKLDADIGLAVSKVQAMRSESSISRASALYSDLYVAEEKLSVSERLMSCLVPSEDCVALVRSGDIDGRFFVAFEEILEKSDFARKMSEISPQRLLSEDVIRFCDELMETGFSRLSSWVTTILSEDRRSSRKSLDSSSPVSYRDSLRSSSLHGSPVYPSEISLAFKLLAQRPDQYADALRALEKGRGLRIRQQIVGMGGWVNPIKFIAGLMSSVLEIGSKERAFLISIVSDEYLASSLTDNAIVEYGTWELLQNAIDNSSVDAAIDKLRLSRLLIFFGNSFSNLFGRGSTVSMLSFNLGNRLLANCVDVLVSGLRLNSADLPSSIPPGISSVISVIQEALRLDEAEGTQNSSTQSLLTQLIPPTLETLGLINQSLSPAMMCVVKLNAISGLLNVVKVISVKTQEIDELLARQDLEISTFVDICSKDVLMKLGLNATRTPLAVAGALRGFYSALFTTGSAIIEASEIDSLNGREIRSEVRRGIAEIIAQEYEKIYKAVGESPEIAPHSPDQIRLLLDL